MHSTLVPFVIEQTVSFGFFHQALVEPQVLALTETRRRLEENVATTSTPDSSKKESSSSVPCVPLPTSIYYH